MVTLEQYAPDVFLQLQRAVPDIIAIGVLLLFAIFGVKVIDVIFSKSKGRLEPLRFKIIGTFIKILFISIIAIIMLSRLGVQQDFLRLIGLVVGGIVAFSSTTLIANLVAGITLHITKPFTPGEIVQVGDILGKVIKMGAVYTEIYAFDKTTRNVANAKILTDGVTNFNESGFRVQVNVSLGYDLNRVEAENTLIKAAKLLHLDDVFVAITDLQDHAIVYQLNATCHDPEAFPFIASRLRKAVLDECGIAEIDIRSPQLVLHKPLPKPTKLARKDKLMLRKKQKEEARATQKLVKDTFESKKLKKTRKKK